MHGILTTLTLFFKSTTMINDDTECCVIARRVLNVSSLLTIDKIARNQPFLIDIPGRVKQVHGLNGD